MLHTRFSRRYLWVVIAFFSFIFITTSAFAQNEASKKKTEQSETTGKNKEKLARKKKEASKRSVSNTEEKEKKPQLQLLGSRITYSVPLRWTKPQASTREKLEALQFTIPLPAAGKASRNTSAILVAEPNTDKLSLSDFSSSRLPRKYPAGTIVADQLDGDSWRTVVSHVHEATPPYSIVDRFGVAAGLRVHFRIILPQEDDAKATWLPMLSQESDDFIYDLQINGKNKVTAHLFYANGNWGLHEGKAAKRTIVKDANTPTEKTKKVETKKVETKKAEAKKVSAKPVLKKQEQPAPAPEPAEEYEQRSAPGDSEIQ